jgi:hypothetical protein
MLTFSTVVDVDVDVDVEKEDEVEARRVDFDSDVDVDMIVENDREDDCRFLLHSIADDFGASNFFDILLPPSFLSSCVLILMLKDNMRGGSIHQPICSSSSSNRGDVLH